MRRQLALSRTVVIVAGAVGALAAPAQAQNCTPFTDVLASDPFCVNIQWMYARAITLGCTANQYCPTQFVRRDQMAAFMNRLGDIVYQDGGNAFGAPAVLGTNDNHALDVIVNGARVMRYEPNAISPNVIGGSPANNVTAGVRGATIGGGGVPSGNTDPIYSFEAPNRVTDAYGTVGGGYANLAGNDAATTFDTAFATVGGGLANTASQYSSTVAGGTLNTASGSQSTVGGGTANTASGPQSTVGGGDSNTASGTFSTVAGGALNTAIGNYSFAAGLQANANATGCFAFANWSSGSGSCLGQPNVARFLLDHGLSVDYFSRRPDGGGNRWIDFGDVFPGLTINTWSGAFLSDAGVWVNASSSREAKTDFAPVDAQAILDQVVALPITTWRYREGEGDIRHIGPMAEDFHAAFEVGYGPHTIADLDARGVALAAIQGLNAKVDDAIKDARRDHCRAGARTRRPAPGNRAVARARERGRGIRRGTAAGACRTRHRARARRAAAIVQAAPARRTCRRQVRRAIRDRFVEGCVPLCAPPSLRPGRRTPENGPTPCARRTPRGRRRPRRGR